jgi:hypothetical protein
VGGVVGYRRAIAKEEAELSKLKSKPSASSSSRPSRSGPRTSPLQDALDKKNKKIAAAGAPKQLPFNPAVHAGKAFLVGSALCIGTIGVTLGLVGWANGVTSQADAVALLRRWGRAVRTGFLEKIMGETAHKKYEDAAAESEVVKKMSYDEEYEYWQKKYFGDSDTDSSKPASENPDVVKFKPIS